MHDATNNPFWSYSLTQYQRPEVAGFCLHGQDIHGLDVNLVLFACWLSEQGIAMDSTLLASRPIRTLQRNLIQPLRQLRNRMKTLSQTKAQVHQWRERIKALELSAERVEQDWLYAWAVQQPKSTMSKIELRKINLRWVWRLADQEGNSAEEEIWIEAAIRCFYPHTI